jgi:uncharacterized protein (DUF952 family)
MATIFHLALASDWAAAEEAGAYTISTRGRTLAEEGFIHASRGDQWPKIRDAFYSNVEEPLLLLQIDTDRLDVPVIDEPPAPGATETFPHIYGPLPVDAVVKAIPVSSPGVAMPDPIPAAAPAAPPPPAPTVPAPAAPWDSFGRIFLTEMFVNMALVVLILVAALVGLAIGGAFGDTIAPLVGLAVGSVAGIGLARWLYVRRHR